MDKKTTKLIIDLSSSAQHESIYADMESFEINFFRMCKPNQFTVRIEDDSIRAEFIKYLEDKKIIHDIGDHCFITIHLQSQIFVKPNHHIELRVIDLNPNA